MLNGYVLPAVVFGLTANMSLAMADYDSGYQWAGDNGADSFSDCSDEFEPSEEEDGCNDYVQQVLYGERKSYGPDNCDEGCNGYEAGYQWAAENGISDEYDCDSISSSFTEGCQRFVREN